MTKRQLYTDLKLEIYCTELLNKSKIVFSTQSKNRNTVILVVVVVTVVVVCVVAVVTVVTTVVVVDVTPARIIVENKILNERINVIHHCFIFFIINRIFYLLDKVLLSYDVRAKNILIKCTSLFSFVLISRIIEYIQSEIAYLYIAIT